MVSDAEIIARYAAVEARMGGFQDRFGNINMPKATAEVAEALGVSQARVATAIMSRESGLLG
jgi:hypothetical protein